ncbi:MAG TPA: hypothetical protein VGS20_02160 [Candidatus Acidoferrales bacterium]|nr:hypothetical protein [Candidatus Acidoferrales bacterium]
MGRKSQACAALLAAAVVLLLGTGYVLAQSETYSESLYSGMQWRLVGPFRGGRVEAVTGIPGDPFTYYMGTVGGGMWKTTDAGLTWDPLWNKGSVFSIGAVAVAYSQPDTVYVGTGEACPRGDMAYGDGIYKSTDGGKTWQHIGLDDTRHIGKILVDPKDPNRVFAAALGHVYGPNTERGVFRSTDGGRTWTKVLYKNDTTGAADLIFDPTNSQTLYAAMWTVQRTPWSLTSGGSPDDGLYKSTDGGDTWQKLGGPGWPQGILGKIGVAVSGANPNRVYALVEATGAQKGLYRSEDGGASWQFVNRRHDLIQRPWYFTHLWADPKNADVIYIQDMGVFRSTDAGKTFATISTVPHGDNHALWIDPTNSSRMIIGNDGGATISNNYGKTWTTVYNQPTAQFYHIAADNRFDYRVYAAQQDNSTLSIATRTRHGGITGADYYPVGGGESAYIFPSPADPDIVFATDKEISYIKRFDKRIEQDQDISEWPISVDGWGADVAKYRFNWTEPIAMSPFDPHTLYHAGNVLFKSTDDGQTWTIISPDLTRNDKSKQRRSGGPITGDNATIEYYDVIYSVVESPLQKGLIWAGTDDGLVWLTRDGGAHWENVTPKDLPEWSKVSLIEASPHDAGAAYLAVNRYKNGDLKPYAWKTGDYGKTWTSIAAGIPEGSFVRAVREDPVRRGLLFAGTEEGIYVSFDDGAHWQSLQLNLPVASVRDLIIHGDDLVVATHGRSIWSLDDITPLRQASLQVADSDIYLFQPQVSYRVRRGGGFNLAGGGPVGKNPPDGAVIDYYFKNAPAGEVSLEILDSQGKLVRRFSSKPQVRAATEGEPGLGYAAAAPPLPIQPGMNRYVWNLRYEAPEPLATGPHPALGGAALGPLALPGGYQVRLTANGETLTQSLVVRMDPEVKTSEADLARQFELVMQIRNRLNDLIVAANQILALRQRLASFLGQSGAAPSALADARSLDGKAAEIENAIYEPNDEAPEDIHNYPAKIRVKMITLQHAVDSADTGPTPQSYEVFKMLSQELDSQLANWKELTEKDVPAFDKMAPSAGLSQLNALKSPHGL